MRPAPAKRSFADFYAPGLLCAHHLRRLVIVGLFLAATPVIHAKQTVAGPVMQIELSEVGGVSQEVLSIKNDDIWIPVLSSSSLVIHADGRKQTCAIRGERMPTIEEWGYVRTC